MDDATMRTGLKMGKSAEEILVTYEPFKNWLSEIDEIIKKEATPITEVKTRKDDDGDDAVVGGATAVADTSSKAKNELNGHDDLEIEESMLRFEQQSDDIASQFVKLLLVPSSMVTYGEMLKKTPLAGNTQCKGAAGNTLLLIDTNLYTTWQIQFMFVVLWSLLCVGVYRGPTSLHL